MTDDVGVINGDLTLTAILGPDGLAHIRVPRVKQAVCRYGWRVRAFGGQSPLRKSVAEHREEDVGPAPARRSRAWVGCCSG
ncbi:hypothetical protein [Streptomyces sp. NPDC051211]|uniref:hypothetical protein n=1 Tax=Streptomyces sp. NPDC051211 TaxID=3154643 RepID=UPI00344B9D23